MDDYLVLHSNQADASSDLTNGQLTFYLGNEYYTNARGSICDVELVLFNASIDVLFNDACLVQTDLPLVNCYNNENSNFNVLGILSDNVGAQRIGSSPVYRTNARPQKITFRLQSLDSSFYDLTDGNFGGVFVLKFSYDDPQENVQEFTQSFYNTLN